MRTPYNVLAFSIKDFAWTEKSNINFKSYTRMVLVLFDKNVCKHIIIYACTRFSPRNVTKEKLRDVDKNANAGASTALYLRLSVPTLIATGQDGQGHKGEVPLRKLQ